MNTYLTPDTISTWLVWARSQNKKVVFAEADSHSSWYVSWNLWKYDLLRSVIIGTWPLAKAAFKRHFGGNVWQIHRTFMNALAKAWMWELNGDNKGHQSQNRNKQSYNGCYFLWSFKMKLDILGHSKRSILCGLNRDIDGFTVWYIYISISTNREHMPSWRRGAQNPPSAQNPGSTEIWPQITGFRVLTIRAWSYSIALITCDWD